MKYIVQRWTNARWVDMARVATAHEADLVVNSLNEDGVWDYRLKP